MSEFLESSENKEVVKNETQKLLEYLTAEFTEVKAQEVLAKVLDNFVAMDELVVAVKTSPQGYMTFIGSVGEDMLDIAVAKIRRGVDEVVAHRRMEVRKKQQSGLIVPGDNGKKHGVMDFVRRRK